MIIYSKHFFKRKDRVLPRPSIFPFIILIMIMFMCMVFCLFPAVKSINVNTPTIDNSIEPFNSKTIITINIVSENTFLYNNNEVLLEELEGFLSQQLKISNEKQDLEDVKIFLRANKNISYDAIIGVIQQLNNAGFTDISLVGK